MASEERVLQPGLGLTGDFSAKSTLLSEGNIGEKAKVKKEETGKEETVGQRVFRAVQELLESLEVRLPSLEMDAEERVSWETEKFDAFSQRANVAFVDGTTHLGYKVAAYSKDANMYLEFMLTGKQEIIDFVMYLETTTLPTYPFVSETSCKFKEGKLMSFAVRRADPDWQVLESGDEEGIEETWGFDTTGRGFSIHEHVGRSSDGEWTREESRREFVHVFDLRPRVEIWLENFKRIQGLDK